MSHDDLQSITKDVAKIGRDVRLRDFLFIAALVVAAGLGSFFVLLNAEYFGWPAILGVLWFNVTAVAAITALVWARSVGRSHDWTLRARFEHEIGSLRKQKWLLDHVHYWFLGPVAIGVSIGAITRDAAESASWVYYMLSALVLAVTYWLCRRESARRFGPLLMRMEARYRDLTAT
jgi:protein-S-isoprenylcysteine O-methyltransferase Ste14